MTLTTFQPRTLGRRATLAIVALWLAVVVALLGYRNALDEHEVYAAEPAREMLAGGNWLLQPFAGAFRTKKPPGQSWLIAASLFATQTRNEYTARLPSAIGGLTLALVLGAIGARLGGRRAGVTAAAMTLTCYVVQVRTHLAEADMALAAAVSLCYGALLRPMLAARNASGADAEFLAAQRPGVATPGRSRDADIDRSRPRGAWLFWLALAAAFLLKGPIAFGFVLLPVVAFAAIASTRFADDRLRAARRGIARVLWDPLALAVALVLIVGWPIGALLTYPPAWASWKYELFARAAGAIRRDPAIAYLGHFTLGPLPWTPLALLAIVAEWPRWRERLRDPAMLLLVLWTFASALFLTGIAFKRLHYALPATGPVLLACAWGAELLLRRVEARSGARTATPWLGGAIAAASVAWLINQAIVGPRNDAMTEAAVRGFAAAANAAVPPGEPIWLVGVGEERTVWYLRQPLRQARQREEESLDAELSHVSGPAWVLCRAGQATKLASAVGGDLRIVTTSESYRPPRESERRALVKIGPARTPASEAATLGDPIVHDQAGPAGSNDGS